MLVLPAIIVCEAVDFTIGAESDAVWFVLLLIPSLSVMAGLSFTPASTKQHSKQTCQIQRSYYPSVCKVRILAAIKNF